jgi:hypothetical protein
VGALWKFIKTNEIEVFSEIRVNPFFLQSLAPLDKRDVVCFASHPLKADDSLKFFEVVYHGQCVADLPEIKAGFNYVQ